MGSTTPDSCGCPILKRLRAAGGGWRERFAKLAIEAEAAPRNPIILARWKAAKSRNTQPTTTTTADCTNSDTPIAISDTADDVTESRSHADSIRARIAILEAS
jgi:hypothetical protein